MSKKQMFGIIGSVFLIVGVFMPIVSVPIVGSINYFMNGKGDGVVVLVLAIISLVLVFAKKYKPLWLTGFASLGMMAFTFLNFQTRMSTAKSDLNAELAGNPFASLGQMALDTVQIQFGWIVLVIGAVLVLCSAAIKEDRLEKHKTQIT